ncbi:probable cation transporter HKT7 [Triticum dicoccoides]|uniref:probable cation transporter HKT7 n=1 Tax=Triticum dicoccoides TaxID=85692 RepID=UPI000E7C3E48|nr:probable cation transporter HKT7 [Triticum dicoccoides]
MAGARHKVGELLRHARRRSTAALDKALSLLSSHSWSYVQHHVVKERVKRWRHALAGRFWRRLGSLLVHVAYFLAVSWLGYLLLAQLRFRAGGDGTRRPRGIDLFFTAVSAATVSSMSTVEMEVFSNGQLLVLTVLMFVGGEVFLSLLGLASKWSKLRKQAVHKSSRRVDNHDVPELEMPPVDAATELANPTSMTSTVDDEMSKPLDHFDDTRLRRDAVLSLFFVVLAILLAVHVLGSGAIVAYVLHASPAARRTLRDKALNVWTFAVFTTVSTFSSCGYMPTNENMIVFKRDTGLQLLLVPQALVGNTLFPPLLAACVRVAAAATRRVELKETAKKGRELTGYYHLLPARRCAMLAATVVGFLAVQVAMLCGMEWGGALRGMSAWEKVSNAVFLAVNSRHTGESTLDLFTLAPAILVLFVLMMYLPPYTTWFPFEESSGVKDQPREETQGVRLLKSTLLSQLSYLAIFVIAICITEREKLKEDPLNFNLLSIVVEVVSAYGNVGFSMGYSCSRQISPDGMCTDRWTGFAGRWSDSGKLILILVMLFGRMKKFSMKAGKAWKLS